MIYKSWMVLNILDKFYYHASSSTATIVMSNQLIYLLFDLVFFFSE